MLSPKTYQIRLPHPDVEIVEKAGTVIKKGGLVVFPTRCLYGLGANAFNAEAVERIFQVKQRSRQKPILILIKHRKQLPQLVTNVPRAASIIMDHFWPGRITLVFEAGVTVPGYLTAGTGKIGIRMPGHPVAAALVNALPSPITGTSANISGRPGCHRIEDLESQVAKQSDLILDAGPLKSGIGSTVVDVTGDIPRILREGKVGKKEIMAIVG